MHEILLAEFYHADQTNWGRTTLDASKARALNGGDQTGPTPTDRAKKDSKHYVITEAKETPLAVRLTRAHRHAVTQTAPLVDTIPPMHGKPGRPRQRPDSACADRAHDSKPLRAELRTHKVTPKIVRHSQVYGSALGVCPYVAERVQAWLHGFKRLRIRYERIAFMHKVFLSLAGRLICYRHL